MTVPATRVLMGIATSILVIGLALTISEADAAIPIPATAARAPGRHPGPVTRRPEGVLIDPYTRAAATCRGLDPLLLVAIHDVETQRDTRGGVSNAGAMGPMQFLPDTWVAYGMDGDRDGKADVWNLNDALAGATHLLCANGVTAPVTHESAIWNYNHSWSYVHRVLARTAELHAAQNS